MQRGRPLLGACRCAAVSQACAPPAASRRRQAAVLQRARRSRPPHTAAAGPRHEPTLLRRRPSAPAPAAAAPAAPAVAAAPSPAARARASAPPALLLPAARAAPRPAAPCAAAAARDDPEAARDDPEVVVVGAGIAGLATAAAFQQVGVPCVVLERRPQLSSAGRAIGLWANAWRALDALGLGDALRPHYLLLDRVELVRDSGRLLRRFGFDECAASEAREFRGVQRAHLLQLLAGQLAPGSLRFDAQVARLDAAPSASSGRATVTLADGRVLRPRLVVGADGVRSAVAAALGLPPPNYAGYVAYRGLATFSDGLPLPPNTIRQIWGAGVRAGMYPLDQSSVYWYTCFNAPQGAAAPASPSDLAAEALSAVRGWRWGIADAIRATPPDTLSRARVADRWGPVGELGRGTVTLAGDAAHPTTPNLGQGGCMALEDAVVLVRTVAPALAADSVGAQARSDALERALRAYERERSPRCLKVTLRSWAFGAALQLPYGPVVAARDAFVERLFQPSHFLDHADYDPGALLSSTQS